MADMTPAELDDLDQVCAKAMGWKYYSAQGRVGSHWEHSTTLEVRYDDPVSGQSPVYADGPFSPTRNPADSWALLRWCWEQSLCDISFISDGHICELTTSDDKWYGMHEDPAIALCLAVRAIEEGK